MFSTIRVNKGPEIVCLKLIMISWHMLLTEVTRTMLMLSTFGREYGKLCEIKSAVDLRFYETNHTSLAKFFKSLVSLVESYGCHGELTKSLKRMKY